MMTQLRKAALGAVLAVLAAGAAVAQSGANPLEIKSIAEVESRNADPAEGRGPVKLIAADRVVPGDRVIYTLEVRNAGAAVVDEPLISFPIPEHMRYVADSAVGPGAEISYSIDGGHSFERAENLTVKGQDGRPRRAAAADYTDIRWRLKNALKANSVAFVRFRALVK
jgi:uncharacterized repeat protein (TIGR01451 family)